jgi:hypothetical protein
MIIIQTEIQINTTITIITISITIITEIIILDKEIGMKIKMKDTSKQTTHTQIIINTITKTYSNPKDNIIIIIITRMKDKIKEVKIIEIEIITITIIEEIIDKKKTIIILDMIDNQSILIQTAAEIFHSKTIIK